MKLLFVLSSFLIYGVLSGETLPQQKDVNIKSSEAKQIVSDQHVLKELLTQRIDSRWKAVEDGDFKKMYGFYTPVKRKLFDFDDFTKSRGKSVAWLGAKIENVAFSGNIATVNVVVSYKLALPDRVAMDLNKSIGSIQTEVRERWIMKDGNWWYIGEPLIDQ